MASVNTKGQLSGGIGSVYYRVLNGKPILQTKPGKGTKQSTGTKVSASDFGIASSIAKNIRLFLFPLLQNMADPYMYTRFTPRIFKAIADGPKQTENGHTLLDGDLSGLNGFQFNINSIFSNYCSLQPLLNREDDGSLSITLPELSNRDSITTVEKATHCDICYLVTAFDSEINIANYQDVFRTTIELKNSNNTIPVQQWVTPPLAAGQLIIVTAAIFYFRQDKLMGTVPLNSKQLHPCEIVAVFKS